MLLYNNSSLLLCFVVTMPLRVDWSRNKSEGEIVITDHKTEIVVTQYYVGDDNALEDVVVAPVRFQYVISGSVQFGGSGAPEDRDSVRKVRSDDCLVFSYPVESPPVRLEAEYVPRSARLGPSMLLVEYGRMVRLSFCFERLLGRDDVWCEGVRVRCPR